MFVSHSCQPSLQASLLAQTHLSDICMNIRKGTCRSPGVLLTAMEWSPGVGTAWVDLLGIALSICSYFTDQRPAVRSGPLSLSWLLLLSNSASCTASSDTAGPCHLPFCPCRDHFQYFYPALFSTGLLPSERSWPPSSPASP